jgi:hypothetical protein
MASHFSYKAACHRGSAVRYRSAEPLPSETLSLDAATAVLPIHHWTELERVSARRRGSAESVPFRTEFDAARERQTDVRLCSMLVCILQRPGTAEESTSACVLVFADVCYNPRKALPQARQAALHTPINLTAGF